MVVVNLHKRVHQNAGNPDLGLTKAVHVDHCIIVIPPHYIQYAIGNPILFPGAAKYIK